jgi:hypothetical protein
MEHNQEPITQLTEIRNLMERSSRFISLSGLSGVAAGIIALIGSGIAFAYLGFDKRYFEIKGFMSLSIGFHYSHAWVFVLFDAFIVLILALLSGVYFTTRKARSRGLKVWDSTARRMLINLLIPLVTGGIFCLILLVHHLVFLLAPATLLFYGLALINTSKYTYHEIRILGISEIILGLLASWQVGYGLLFWAVGFGVLHIIYGLVMYFRYEEGTRDKGQVSETSHYESRVTSHDS